MTTAQHGLRDPGAIAPDLALPTELFRHGDHAVYWIGLHEESRFRCNNYLLRSGARTLLIDPGSRAHFAQAMARVAQIVDPSEVTDLVICHQDPDVAASMVDWLDLNPELTIITSARTQVLLPYFGKRGYRWLDIASDEGVPLAGGERLRFIPAPFLHAPAAFTTYDPVSRFLFSGDIWAAISNDWYLMVHDFTAHRQAMDRFHLHYMACNRACRGFVRRLEGLAIEAILPQHGSIIGPQFVDQALDYLRRLRCGLDLEYGPEP